MKTLSDELIKANVQELEERLKEMEDFMKPYLTSIYSFETNMDKIFDLMVEVEKNISDYGSDITDAQIRDELRDEINDLRELIFKLTNKTRKLAKFFKVDLDEKNIVIEKVEEIAALLERSNRLQDELVTERMAILEIIRDNFEDFEQMKPVNFIDNLLSTLNEFVELSADLEAFLEDGLDFEIEDMEDRLERFEREKERDFFD